MSTGNKHGKSPGVSPEMSKGMSMGMSRRAGDAVKAHAPEEAVTVGPTAADRLLAEASSSAASSMHCLQRKWRLRTVRQDLISWEIRLRG